MRIVFATKNEGKVKEIREMLQGLDIELISLNAYGETPEIVEDQETYLGNALKKAKMIAEFTGEDVLADDSGLQVDVLGGRPGIYSARYAGMDATDEENNAKLLANLKRIPPNERTASFCCALVLYRKDGRYESFEATWQGRIIDECRGDNGFGYDPIFWVPELEKTAAELPAEIKNKISHRGQAFARLKESLCRSYEA